MCQGYATPIRLIQISAFAQTRGYMAEQYWIGDFYIDLSRNQITKNKDPQTLAPKALAVLTYLAENQGTVISQEALLDHVWPNTVVSTNTLQRCIAQLRKALGDDGRVQVYIKTHAKKGYSLECDVRWLKETSFNSNPSETLEVEQGTGGSISANSRSSHSKPTITAFLATFCLIILSFIGYRLFEPKPDVQLSVGQIQALTATDNREVSGVYSPDGQYIVFHRYSDEFCANNIWAKNIKTHQEFQLTNSLGSYGSHSFSKDGKHLVFVQSKTCTEPVEQKKCYYLMKLDFEKALNAPQDPELLLECKNSEIHSAKWLNNNQIALVQKTGERRKLISYSPEQNQSQVIYELPDGTILDYDYSIEDDLIALTSIHNDGHYYIETVNPDGQLLTSHRINYPEGIATFRRVSPNFSPFEDLLLFSTGRRLFTMSYDGEVAKVSLPLDQSVGSPIFHPQAHRMLATKGQWDGDIVSVSLFDIRKTQATNQASVNYARLERTTADDNFALFQPNGKLIAYRSGRSGQNQIWIYDGIGSQQLSQFPIDTLLGEIAWAADGQSILANVDKELVQLYLNGQEKHYALGYPVENLFEWNSANQTALGLVRIKELIKFVELNLVNSTVRIINDKKVNRALTKSNGQIIYTDHMDRFWQPGPAEDQLIPALVNQGSNKGFVVRNNVIYGINEDFELWSYSINSGNFETIGKVSNRIEYISDINENQALMTYWVSGKKEIVELILE